MVKRSRAINHAKNERISHHLPYSPSPLLMARPLVYQRCLTNQVILIAAGRKPGANDLEQYKLLRVAMDPF